MKTLERKKLASAKRIFVVSKHRGRVLRRHRDLFSFLWDRAAIHSAILSPGTGDWLASDQDAASDILAEAIRNRVAKHRLGSLIFLEPPRLESLAPALDLFRSVAWTNDPKHWLPIGELLDVLSTTHPEDYLVGGTVDQEAGTLTVYRGDFGRLTVPLSMFEPTTAGVEIDASDFEVIDSGHAVRLGRYEAAADAIFYECDPEYRKRLRSKRRAEEKTFGASLRRLRIQRGLRQNDFDLPAKTIARIERGEVEKPQGRTLAKIAARVGVAAEEIESY